MELLDMAVNVWNMLPDSVRIIDGSNPVWLVLRVIAMLTGHTLFEDASFGP